MVKLVQYLVPNQIAMETKPCSIYFAPEQNKNPVSKKRDFSHHIVSSLPEIITLNPFWKLEIKKPFLKFSSCK
jgi:hypothetical protein